MIILKYDFDDVFLTAGHYDAEMSSLQWRPKMVLDRVLSIEYCV